MYTVKGVKRCFGIYRRILDIISNKNLVTDLKLKAIENVILKEFTDYFHFYGGSNDK